MFKTNIVLCVSSYVAAYLVIQMALGNSPLGNRVLSRDLQCLALIAILSAGKYSSDFNAKKIVSVARSVPEISSVE